MFSFGGSFGLPTMDEMASMALNHPSFQTRVLQAAPAVMSSLQPSAQTLGAGQAWNAATRGVGTLGNISASQDNLASLYGMSNITRTIRNPDGSTTVLRGMKKGGKVRKYQRKQKNLR